MLYVSKPGDTAEERVEAYKVPTRSEWDAGGHKGIGDPPWAIAVMRHNVRYKSEVDVRYATPGVAVNDTAGCYLVKYEKSGVVALMSERLFHRTFTPAQQPDVNAPSEASVALDVGGEAGGGRTARAYRERAIAAVLAVKMALAAGYKAGKGLDTDAAPGSWPVVLYVDFPGGQISWRIATDDEDLLAGIPDYDGVWDGEFESRTGDRVVAWRPEQAPVPRPLCETYGQMIHDVVSTLDPTKPFVYARQMMAVARLALDGSRAALDPSTGQIRTPPGGASQDETTGGA